MQATQFANVSSFERVSPAQVERARQFQSAILCDAVGRRGALHGRIQPLSSKMKVVGPAFPVEVRPGDNLMIHAALALARPGDVLIVDGKGYQSSALFGELMATQAVAAGLAGVVMDGAVRDTDVLSVGTLPVFASGRNPAGPTKGLGGTIGMDISIGGVAVRAGDLVIGDSDGVVVIPRDQVDAALDAGEDKVKAEGKRLQEIAAGVLVSPWLDDALRAAGIISAMETLT
jgi:4-hydroxy-4-methyl-2-oxoglutarate aldolase